MGHGHRAPAPGPGTASEITDPETFDVGNARTIDTWQFAPASAKRIGHPAPYPVELPRRCIELYTYRGDVVLDRLEQRLTADGVAVRRYAKPTFAKPAPVDLRHEIAVHCEVVIEALAD